MNVIELASRRAKLARQPRTLIVRAVLLGVEPVVVRQIGINDALSTAALGDVLAVCFGLELDQPVLQPSAAGEGCIHSALRQPGDRLLYSLGLWDIEVAVVDTYVRDDGTPQALCVGGSGSFRGQEFDPGCINALLVGEETTQAVLAQAHPEVRAIIQRSGIFDFVSLLQALDLGRQVDTAPDIEVQLPQSPTARTAAWVLLLAAASLATPQEQEEVAVATMEAMYERTFRIAQIRALCPEVVVAIDRIQHYAPLAQVEWFRTVLVLGGILHNDSSTPGTDSKLEA